MKDKSELSVILKEAGILFAITLLSGLLLGFVYELTKGPIRIQQENAIKKACVEVLPGSSETTEFIEIEYTVPESIAEEIAAAQVTIGTVYRAEENGTLLGYVVEACSNKAYGGKIILYVGVKTDASVGGVSILKINETVGLGMEAPNVLTPQFAGKRADSFVYTKNGAKEENEVDAISGATITTKAVTNAVNGGLKVALDLLKGGAGND